MVRPLKEPAKANDRAFLDKALTAIRLLTTENEIALCEGIY